MYCQHAQLKHLQKIRGQALPRESAYQQDYREMGIIKKAADKLGVGVLFVHHNRKMKDDADPFNMISGTNGIMGAADTIFVITKKSRQDRNATLHITGRDVTQNDIIIEFDNNTCRWNMIGDTSSIERNEYNSNSIVKSIKSLLDKNPQKKWKGTATSSKALSPTTNSSDPVGLSSSEIAHPCNSGICERKSIISVGVIIHSFASGFVEAQIRRLNLLI